MEFQSRNRQEQTLVEIFVRGYWSQSPIATQHGLEHHHEGQEYHLPEDVREMLRRRYDDEALAIRFQPDAMINSTNKSLAVIFLEYKTTTTPRYTSGAKQWDEGQIEADAWENYLRLANSENPVAVLIYCSYHSRPLLCDYVNPQWVTRGRTSVLQTTRGSRTDYVNIDLTQMRTFVTFMYEEFQVPTETSNLLVADIMQDILNSPELQTTHDQRSPVYGQDEYKTGFNWNWP